jgi:hypothetical protein
LAQENLGYRWACREEECRNPVGEKKKRRKKKNLEEDFWDLDFGIGRIL